MCKETHAVFNFKYFGSNLYPRQMHLILNDGNVEDHTFDTVGMGARYLRLPEKPESPEQFLRTCEEQAADTSEWAGAIDESDLRKREWLKSKLIEAIDLYPSKKIVCADIDGKSCKDDLNAILAWLRVTPPYRTDDLFIPGEGEIHVHKFYDSKIRGEMPGSVQASVTIEYDLKGKPRSLSIRFVNVPSTNI